MSTSVEEVLIEATTIEKEYEWLQASELYEQALGIVDEEDFFRRGEIEERIGHCLQRTAFQAESREGFLESIQYAMQVYEEARGLYEKSGNENAAWVLRCKAISKYLDHWTKPDPSEKLKLLSDCHELEKGALNFFWDTGNKLEYCRTYIELVLVTEFILYREWDQEVRRKTLETRLSWGEKSIKILRELGKLQELARTLWAYALSFRILRLERASLDSTLKPGLSA